MLCEEELPFYFYQFLIAHFSGLPLLGSSCSRMCAHILFVTFTLCPFDLRLPACLLLSTKPSFVLLGLCSCSMEEISLLLSDSTSYPFLLRQLQMGRGWGGNLKETKKKNSLFRKIYKTSLFCANICQMGSP